MEIKDAKILEKLSEISFKILDFYNELIKLETNIKTFEYEEKRKRIIEKIVALSLQEDDIYGQLKHDPDTVKRIINFINKNYLNNPNNNITNFDVLFELKDNDNNIVIFRILDSLLNLYKMYKPKEDSDYHNENVGFLLSEGIDMISARYFYDESGSIIIDSFHTRKAANIKHEADNMKSKDIKNALIRSYYRQIFFIKHLEDILLQTEFKKVPCKLDEELKIGIVPKKVQNNYINYIMLKRVKKIISIMKEEISFPIECIITFKTLLLYLTEEGIEEIKEIINTTDFKLFYFKKLLLDEIKYLNVNKAYHNSDMQEKKEMN